MVPISLSICRKRFKIFWLQGRQQGKNLPLGRWTDKAVRQGWNKKGMSFVPYRHFYEFIPETEWEKSRQAGALFFRFRALLSLGGAHSELPGAIKASRP